MENSSCVCSDLCKCHVFPHHWYWCNSLRTPVALDWLDETHRLWEVCVMGSTTYVQDRKQTGISVCIYICLTKHDLLLSLYVCIWNSACMSELLHWVSVSVCGCVVTGIILLEQAQLPIILFTQPLKPLTQNLSAGLAGLSFTPYKSMGCSPTSCGCVSLRKHNALCVGKDKRWWLTGHVSRHKTYSVRLYWPWELLNITAETVRNLPI